MHNNGLWTRALASLVSTGLILVQVPGAGAASSLFGTVRGAGSAWVTADSTNWSEFSSARPLIAGDSIRTGEDGFALAELGSHGTIGLYSGAEVRASGSSEATVIDVARGKVAFHVGEDSPLAFAAAGVSVKGRGQSDGYFDGTESLTVERGSVQVALVGNDRTVRAGQRFHFATQAVETIDVAGAYGEPAQPEEIPAAPPAPAAESQAEQRSKQIPVAAWIIGGLALAGVITAVAVTASDNGGGHNGSASNNQ